MPRDYDDAADDALDSSRATTPDPSQAFGLVAVLRALPKKEFTSLIRRVDASVDPAKRIDVPSQVARALLMSPEFREPGRHGRAAAELGVVRLESVW